MRRLPEQFQLHMFRWPLAVASAFTVITLLLFGFLYWQAAAYMTARMDAAVTHEADRLAENSDERRTEAIQARLQYDPRRIKLTALFAPDGRRLLGNIAAPLNLPLDAPARAAKLVRIDERGREAQVVRVVARRLPNGDVLVVGRNVDELGELAHIVREALVIGILPTFALAIAAGMALTDRTRRRIEEVTRTAQRIVAGDLRERLPIRGANREFTRLAHVLNGMLDEIERLVQEISGVGDDIAHELRTPLTRARAILERGRANSRTVEELQAVVDRAIAGLDRSLAITTALLRIAEIEHSRRLDGFGEVDLAGIVRELGELYQPIAEDRNIHLSVTAADRAPLRGDRDLLLEAIANLIDNAIKFTPAGGRVDVALHSRAGEHVVRVADDGPGIPGPERDVVTRRFYRSDKSRHTPGFGLGLTLVAAIARLHGFRLSIGGSPGCVVEFSCPRALAI